MQDNYELGITNYYLPASHPGEYSYREHREKPLSVIIRTSGRVAYTIHKSYIHNQQLIHTDDSLIYADETLIGILFSLIAFLLDRIMRERGLSTSENRIAEYGETQLFIL